MIEPWSSKNRLFLAGNSKFPSCNFQTFLYPRNRRYNFHWQFDWTFLLSLHIYPYTYIYTHTRSLNVFELTLYIYIYIICLEELLVNSPLRFRIIGTFLPSSSQVSTSFSFWLCGVIFYHKKPETWTCPVPPFGMESKGLAICNALTGRSSQ